MKIKKIILLPLIAITFTSCELNLGTSGLLSNDTTSNVNSDIEPSSNDKIESESSFEINSGTSQFENSPTSEEIDPNLVKLKVWCDPQQVNFMDEAATKFRTLYPEVKFDFTIEGVSDNDALSRISSDFDSTADVFHFYGDHLMPLYKQGFLHDFNSDESRIKLNSLGFSKGCLSSGQINGTQYAIPYTPNTYFMYYDSSVYTEEDVKSLTNMLKVNVSEKKSSYKYNAALDFASGWYGQSILYSFGASINESTGSFDNAEKGAKYLAQCIHNEKLIMTSGYSNFGFDAAAVVSGTWTESYAKQVLGSDFACAPLPTLNFENEEVPWKAVGDYKMIGVKSTTQELIFASRFALFLSSAEIQRDRFIKWHIAPTNEKVLEYPEVASNKAIVAQTKTLAHTFNQPSHIYEKNNYWSRYELLFYSDLKKADTDEKVVLALNNFNNALKNSFQSSL